METSNEPNYEVSLGKILLGNWVEERQVAHLDSPKTIKELHVQGHSSVLTHTGDQNNLITTCTESYKEPVLRSSSQTGKRREMLEKELYEKISAQIQEEMNPGVPPIDFTSTTKKDFTREYEKTVNAPTMDHCVNTEMPLTFWRQNLNTIHGITQVNQTQSPFKKNASFSTPVSESKDAPKPGEDWNY